MRENPVATRAVISALLAGSARVCHSGLFMVVRLLHLPCSSGLIRASGNPSLVAEIDSMTERRDSSGFIQHS